VPVDLSVMNSVLCIYGLCVILGPNRDYSFEQHEPDDLCNGNVLFSLLYGMNS
jgi:hypothetical protein